MTKKELREKKRNRDELLNNIINKGKKIAVSTIDSYQVYMLLNDTVWYCPRGRYPTNCGTLKEFTVLLNNNKLKAKLV